MKLATTCLLLLVTGEACADVPEISLINPPGLFQPTTFSQIATIREGRLVLISGQTARDAAGKLVGQGDLKAQTGQVFENLRIALQSVGADFDDVAKLTTFVVNLQPNDRVMIAEAIAKYFPPGRRPAHTLIGISALAVEDLLIEIEATAVLPD